MSQLMVSYKDDFSAYSRSVHDEGQGRKVKGNEHALRAFLDEGGSGADGNAKVNTGFTRIEACRLALTCMDRQGWERSFFQKKFHDAFMQATARVFWKVEGGGQFARDHQAILEKNGWNHLAQEVLISTPRRFGKTISVSMFAAAMIFSAARVEVSIYSTCKRISQKLLRNVRKFLNLVFWDMGMPSYRVIRENQEEIMLQGPEGDEDIRIVNSYPSRVGAKPLFFAPRPAGIARACVWVAAPVLCPPARGDCTRMCVGGSPCSWLPGPRGVHAQVCGWQPLFFAPRPAGGARAGVWVAAPLLCPPARGGCTRMCVGGSPSSLPPGPRGVHAQVCGWQPTRAWDVCERCVPTTP